MMEWMDALVSIVEGQSCGWSRRIVLVNINDGLMYVELVNKVWPIFIVEIISFVRERMVFDIVIRLVMFIKCLAL